MSSAFRFTQLYPSFISCVALTLLAPCFVPPGNAQLQNRFAPLVHPIYPSTYEYSDPVAVTDMNGDGVPDLIVVNADPNIAATDINIFPGLGNGTFGKVKVAYKLPSMYTILGGPNGVFPAKGDFNRDGRLDMVTINTSGQVQLLAGQQDDTFRLLAPGAVVCHAYCPTGVTADFNGDGKLDLAVWDMNSQAIRVLPGRGDGTFGAAVTTSEVPGSNASNYGLLVPGDFNRDGRLDLAVADGTSQVRMFLGNGDGSFHEGANVSFPGITANVGMGGLIAVDLRGDGELDLVATSDQKANGCAGTGLFVAPGNGNGTFGGIRSYRLGMVSGPPLAADVNHDGRPDILVRNNDSASFSVLLNDGAGRLRAASNYKADGSGYGMIAADVNGDGHADVIYGTINGPTVYLALPDGHFHLPASLELDAYVQALEPPADLNHDGIADVLAFASPDPAICGGGDHRAFLHPALSSTGIGLSKFPAPSLGPNATSSVGLGYYNGDSSLDAIAIGTYTSPPNDVEVYFNNGYGYFSSPTRSFSSTTAAVLAGGDFNRDGKSDVAILNGNTVQVLLGNGGESFGPAVDYAVGAQPVFLAQRDVNHDGKTDLVVVNQGSNSVSVLLGRGDGTFQAQREYAVSSSPFSLAYADFNRDGNLDLVVAGTTKVSVLLGKGDGTFQPAMHYATGVDPLNAITTADLRGRGDVDVIATTESGNLLLLPGLGNGKLGAPEVYNAQNGSQSGLLGVGDLNGDGAADLVVSHPGSAAPIILYNQGGTRIVLASSARTITAGHSVTFSVTIAASVPGVGPPYGTVAFKDGPTTLGTATLTNGTTHFTTTKLRSGYHVITASYYGAGLFNPHVSTGISVQVNP